MKGNKIKAMEWVVRDMTCQGRPQGGDKKEGRATLAFTSKIINFDSSYCKSYKVRNQKCVDRIYW